MKTILLCAALAAFLAGCASAPEVPFSAKGFAEATQVIDDPMNTAVLVRSPRIPQPRPHPDVSDYSLQLVASINRRTGETLVVVRQEMTHRISSWLFFKSATYQDIDGNPVEAKTFSRPRGDVDYCSGGGCTLSEGGAFAVPEAVLLGVVLRDQLKRDPEASWRVRFRTDRDYVDGSIGYERIDGFLKTLSAARLRIPKKPA